MSSARTIDNADGEECPTHVDTAATGTAESAVTVSDNGSTGSASVGGDYCCDETDDISDILGASLLDDAGGLPTLSASGQMSVLSASAVEFTPGGQGQGQQVEPVSSSPLGTAGYHGGVGPAIDVSFEDDRDEWEYTTSWVGENSEGHEISNGCSVGQDQDQNPYYAQVQLEAEVLDLLAESFSDCSLESLQVALAKGDWNLDRASAAVLSALEATAYESSSSPGAKSKPPPCRHLLLGGECRRSDCAFSHDFAATTCRYWLRGQCANPAEECHFLHDLQVPEDNDGDNMGGSASIHTAIGVQDNDVDGRGFEIDQFPSLEPKKVFPSSEPNTLPDRLTFPAGGVHGSTAPTTAAQRREPPNSSSAEGTTAKVLSDTNFSLLQGSSLPVHPEQQQLQWGQRAAEATVCRKERNQNEDDGEAEEDVLLAAVVAATSGGKGGKGGKAGGRKGGRGRKTRFTAVSLQTLLKPTSDSPPSGESRTGTGAGHRSIALPPTAFSGARLMDGPSSGPSGGPIPTAARTTKAGVSFASVVGSSPSIPSASSSLQSTAIPAASSSGRGVTSGGGVGVPAASRNAWGGGGGAGNAVGQSGWVSTGDAVAAQYEQARKEAGELARARNKLFTLATEAFRRGEGMIARDLARRGRELNSQMKEKHRQAAADIFASRNPGDQVFERQTVDLHGLHVSEAIEALDREMAELANRGVCSVKVLTGTGHHSKGPYNKARLIPAVEYFCQARGFPFREIPDQSTSHVGAVEIDFKGLQLL